MAETVTVACKLPNGLELRLYDMVDVDVPVMGGGTKVVKEARATVDASVVIKGNAVPFGTMPVHRIEGGYALTPNVSKDFFDAWLVQNRNHPAVMNKLIWAHAKEDAAVSMARNLRDVRSGLEPIDPAKPGSGLSKYDGKAEAA